MFGAQPDPGPLELVALHCPGRVGTGEIGRLSDPHRGEESLDQKMGLESWGICNEDDHSNPKPSALAFPTGCWAALPQQFHTSKTQDDSFYYINI